MSKERAMVMNMVKNDEEGTDQYLVGFPKT
jgi:hypothetical protein